MNKKYLNIFVVLMILMASCANRGQGPQGGPRDSIPPMVRKETPLNGTLSFQGNKIEVTFDEYIQLDDVQNKVLLSPPQKTTPEVKAIGKTLSIVFQEDLLDSTTYTIDFGSAICDYNEKTPLEGYVYAFSTGDHIDSLVISGCVYDASTLNPQPDVLVGIHRCMEDSALSTLPFSRITRADSEGNFVIYNIQPGKYRLYALNDISRDFLYQPGEALAFSDSIITPSCEVKLHCDTIWRDSLSLAEEGDTIITPVVDSIIVHPVTRFYPDSLVLWYFEEDKKRHYFQGVRRDEQHTFTLIFSAPQDSMPVLRALRPSEIDSLNTDSAWVNCMDYCMMQVSRGMDTITCWLTDSLAIGMDSIYLQMQYKVTDSLYNLVSQVDTILAIYRSPRMSEKARETLERKKRERKLELKSNASASFDIYDTIRIYSAFPLESVHDSMFHFLHKVDTLFNPIPFVIQKYDTLAMVLYVIAKLQPEESYQLKVDSAACRDIYGACNDSIQQIIKLKSRNDYSSLRVKLATFDARARIQLLNDKEAVVKELSATEEGALFQYLEPSTFYLRLYIDENEDGKWSTGDWSLHRQPEPIYYYPKKLKLRANWDFEEIFDYLAKPRTESKPRALSSKKKKNK